MKELIFNALLALIIVYFYFWIWKPSKHWERRFIETTRDVLENLEEERQRRVAKLLVLSLWCTEPPKSITELLESYVNESVEEVWREYGL